MSTQSSDLVRDVSNGVYNYGMVYIWFILAVLSNMFCEIFDASKFIGFAIAWLSIIGFFSIIIWSILGVFIKSIQENYWKLVYGGSIILTMLLCLVAILPSPT